MLCSKDKAGQVKTNTIAFAEMRLLCVTDHQPAGVQAAEAQSLHQTSVNPVAQATSSITEAQQSAVVPKTSTWTGLVHLDKAEVHSIAADSNSSEISEEHIVIHLKPEEGWKDGKDGPGNNHPSQEETDGPKSSNTLGLSDLESLESHGGSAHEEEDGSYFGADSPTLSSIASSTPQPQTSNNVLAEFVNTLMRPFRYWTGGKEGEKTQEEHSASEEKAGENQMQSEVFSRNLSLPKASKNKGSMDNAIMEHRSGSVSSRVPASGLQPAVEGLSEQEKEVMPLIRLVPAVQNKGGIDTSSSPGERAPSTSADSSMSAVHGEFVLFRVHL